MKNICDFSCNGFYQLLIKLKQNIDDFIKNNVDLQDLELITRKIEHHWILILKDLKIENLNFIDDINIEEISYIKEVAFNHFDKLARTLLYNTLH